ncbi:MAG: SMP-30/gluconolactonase/LRE family protein [Chloroflexota bacterium]
MSEQIIALLENPEPERWATGFEFTEGPLWHPEGYFTFADIRTSRLYKLASGGSPEIIRENTGNGNGNTFDLQGNLLLCEGGNRQVTRMTPDGQVAPIATHHEGKRLNRPNDIICRSDGMIYFTDLGTSVPLSEREIPHFGVYRIALDGTVSLFAGCEAPNGLAFSPDEQTLYVSNTKFTQYIHDFEVAADGTMGRRRFFADMSSDEKDGVPDGMKVDAAGRIFCTGAGGLWVFEANGTSLGMLRLPEIPANVAFGGPDLKTLFVTARTSVYALRVKTPGLPHPRFAPARPG